jgi:hypothetical protein
MAGAGQLPPTVTLGDVMDVFRTQHGLSFQANKLNLNNAGEVLDLDFVKDVIQIVVDKGPSGQW